MYKKNFKDFLNLGLLSLLQFLQPATEKTTGITYKELKLKQYKMSGGVTKLLTPFLDIRFFTFLSMGGDLCSFCCPGPLFNLLHCPQHNFCWVTCCYLSEGLVNTNRQKHSTMNSTLAGCEANIVCDYNSKIIHNLILKFRKLMTAMKPGLLALRYYPILLVRASNCNMEDYCRN